MMRFALLASGSKGNCFIVRDGSTRLVIDCGSTLKYLRSCFSALQVNRDEISAVLITHDHSDHIAQIRHFAGYEMYSPVDIADICRANVVSRMPFSVGSLTITPPSPTMPVIRAATSLRTARKNLSISPIPATSTKAICR